MTASPHRSAQAGRRYAVRLTAAMSAYVVTVVAAALALPMVPAAFVALAVLRYTREADEMQRRIVLESLAAAFALGSLLTFGYGLLQVAGAPDVSWMYVWPVYAGSWLLFGLLARRRY